MADKFEYVGANIKIETAQGYIDYLNKKGEEGWELVTSGPSMPEGHVFCVFKRKKSALVSVLR